MALLVTHKDMVRSETNKYVEPKPPDANSSCYTVTHQEKISFPAGGRESKVRKDLIFVSGGQGMAHDLLGQVPCGGVGG